jgi:DNA-binding transcriptional ArsR family regulator
MNGKELEKIFKAVANRRRIAMIGYLRSVHRANVGRIAFEMALSLNATSRHLMILERAGFLDREQRALEVFYRIAASPGEPVRTILGALPYS